MASGRGQSKRLLIALFPLEAFSKCLMTPHLESHFSRNPLLLNDSSATRLPMRETMGGRPLAPFLASHASRSRSLISIFFAGAAGSGRLFHTRNRNTGHGMDVIKRRKEWGELVQSGGCAALVLGGIRMRNLIQPGIDAFAVIGFPGIPGTSLRTSLWRAHSEDYEFAPLGSLRRGNSLYRNVVSFEARPPWVRRG